MNAIFEQEILGDGTSIRVARAKPAVEVITGRDPRAMNHMDKETRVIHARLDEWSSYVKRALNMLGYPAESYYHKWAALKIAPNPGFDAEMPERPANVDRAVARLGEIDKSVIWRYYCQFRPTLIWKGLRAIDSKSEFDKILRRARWRCDGILMEIEKSI